MLGAVRRLLADGHELAGVLTFECDNIFNFNRETIALARSLGALSILSPPQDIHIEGFLDKGARCVLAAGYPYKIPPVDNTRAYGINLHPSLLPRGRGLMPTPHIILGHPEAAGISIHKLTSVFDDGDILLQEALPLSPRETVETYSARIAMRGEEMLAEIMTDLPGYWMRAKPQDRKKASNFPPPSDDMRLLDWTAPVTTIERTGRAFGRFGALAQVESSLLVVYHFDTWTARHELAPGTLAHRGSRDLVIAARDGFVCLKDYQPAKI